MPNFGHAFLNLAHFEHVASFGWVLFQWAPRSVDEKKI